MFWRSALDKSHKKYIQIGICTFKPCVCQLLEEAKVKLEAEEKRGKERLMISDGLGQTNSADFLRRKEYLQKMIEQ